MKKFVALAIIILIFTIPTLTSCRQPSSGGEVLSNDQKLIAEKETPTTGTPADYSPQDNLAFAAYKFNRASSWESIYTGEVIAVGTTQRVENIRKLDSSGALFAQAISVSGVKSVAEQKYFKDDTILYRPYVKLDKKTMAATWSSAISTLSREEYFRNYGLIPNEIFKYAIDETTILSAEKINSDNYAFRFVLSVDCVKYLKNEVRTMSGAKSDPEFLSVECTVEMDESWNVIRTTLKEKYKVAIMGGVTCESSATEVFTIGGNVSIPDKAIFESFAPGSGETVDPPKQPIDYLTLAFTNLADDSGKINLEAQIGSFDAVINLDSKSGLFTFKLGNTVIKNAGDYMYILGDAKVKFDSLSLYETLYFALSRLPLDSLGNMSFPLDAPEIEMLINELKGMLSNSESSDNQGGESAINKILDGMDMKDHENGATVTMEFSLDGINFDVQISVTNDRLDSIVGDISYQGKSLHIELSPTTKQISADISGASDISKLLEAISMRIQSGSLSLESGDYLVTLGLNGTVCFNSSDINASLQDKLVKLDILGKKLCLNIATLDLTMPKLEIADILKAIGAIKSLPLSADVTASENRLDISFSYDTTNIEMSLSAENGLNISLNVGGMTFVSTDKVATMDEEAKYVNADNLLKVAQNIITDGRVDLHLDADVGFIKPVIDVSVNFIDGYLVIKTGETTIQATDALYIVNDNIKGKLSYDCFGSISMPDIPSIDVKSLLAAIWNDTEISNDGDALVIKYKSSLNGANINLVASITNSIDLSGKVTYNGTDYTFALGNGTKLKPVSTEGCVSLDPIVYFARDIITSSPTFEANVTVGENIITAFVMPDIENKGAIAQVSDSYLYIYDKIYLKNNSGKFSLAYKSILSVLKNLGVTDNLDVQSILTQLFSGEVDISDLSINKTGDNLLLSANINNILLQITFAYSTNYLKTVKLISEKFDVELKPSDKTLLLPQSFEGYMPIDHATELVSPIKNMISEKHFTLTFNEFKINLDAPITLNGHVYLDMANDLALELDITISKETDDKIENHRVEAVLLNGDITAAYNEKLKINISKENLFNLIFKVTDVMGLKLEMLEQFRPDSSEPVSSEIIYNALPQSFKDTIAQITDLAEKGIDIAEIDFAEIISYIDTLAISGEQGNVTISVNSPSPISVTVLFDNSITDIRLVTDKLSGNIAVDHTAHTIAPLGNRTYNYNINSLTELIDCALNTVNLGEYNVSGNISLSILVESFEAVNIKFTLVSKILENSPLVYLKLEVPYYSVPLVSWFYDLSVTKANSYIFFYDGIMYLKSERFPHSWGRDTYKETLYLKRTPAEFAANLVQDLFFLVPLSNELQNLITKNIQNSETKIDFTDALTKFDYNNDVFGISVDLKALTSNSNLGNLDLTLAAGKDNDDNRILNKFSVNMKLLGSLITIVLDAQLNEYNGEIEYGIESEKLKSDISQMRETMEKIISKWQ